MHLKKTIYLFVVLLLYTISFPTSELLMKESWRDNMNDYVNGSRMMLYLEERANTLYLRRFNQKNIRLTYYMGQQFYFPITVRYTFYLR